jgi:hypothetical protein
MPVTSEWAPYHIALEVKTDKVGNRSGKSDGIEGAVTQLCVGLNGMAHFFARNLHIHESETGIDFLPVLFTTAEIYTTELDLRTANIIDGNVTFKDTDIESKPWIAYQYHQSPNLKHSLVSGTWPNKIGDILDFAYVRTVLVVSASGIESFLGWASNLTKVQ